MNTALSKLAWLAVAVVGALALGIVALSRGETINAVWLVLAAVCSYLVAFRFYGVWFVSKMGADPNRQTPAYRYNDGLDYVPTRPINEARTKGAKAIERAPAAMVNIL